MAAFDPVAQPEHFICHNGQKQSLPFAPEEYRQRLAELRQVMAEQGVPAVLFSSMHNIAYYSGFLYCSFGRPYGCIVTPDRCVTVSANIDYGQPWRRCVDENIVYTDWKRDNYWRAVKHVLGPIKKLGVEFDHLTLERRATLDAFLDTPTLIDMSPLAMRQRMIKSPAEIDLIRGAAAIADIGGEAVRDAIRVGVREIDVAMAGRDAMEAAIAERYPDSELRDSWVWFQAGINTDGAHNPVTTRKLEAGDLLSLNTFPMVSGYYVALERTLTLGEPDTETRRLWELNVQAHELGQSLIRPGVKCSEICAELNRFLSEHDALRYRTFGYGHSFGVLSHYYGREAGLELREDIDTVLEPGMVVSMEPMLTIPEEQAGAGGYREHDILVVQKDGAENITGFPYGPEHNVIAV